MKAVADERPKKPNTCKPAHHKMLEQNNPMAQMQPAESGSYRDRARCVSSTTGIRRTGQERAFPLISHAPRLRPVSARRLATLWIRRHCVHTFLVKEIGIVLSTTQMTKTTNAPETRPQPLLPTN
jgi:hypothetical protein